MNDQAQPLVYVIVLHWRNYEHTHAAITSILKNSYANYRVIIVDNGSFNTSVEQLQREFPQVTFKINDSNLGFSKGCNVGIQEALKDVHCEYVLLMNNDATIERDSLQAAVDVAEKRSSIGIVSGKILSSRPPHTIWYAGGRIHSWRGRAVVRGFGEVDRGQYDHPSETGFVTGALMLIKRVLLTTVGLLSEEYFFGVEDWDFSERTRRAGFTIYYEPSCLAHHAADGSHWNYDPKFFYNCYRNKLIFQQNHLPRLVFRVWKAAFAFYGKHFARRARQRQIDKKLFSLPAPVEFDKLDFALARAVEDHGKNEMSEAVLNSFETELRIRFQSKTG
jgi:GT2 family glycosyltransferase